MFCSQDAYSPELLVHKNIQLRRLHAQAGTASRKSISKQSHLKPYFDYDFSETQSSRIAHDFERYIKETRKHKKEIPQFVDGVLNKILYLHKYNLKVAEVTFRYPLTKNFKQLLLHFIALQCNVLYRREYYTPTYEVTIKERILRLLLNIYNSCFESLVIIPPTKIFEESAKAILKLLIELKLEFDIHNKLIEDIAKKLLDKLGKLENITALEEICIPCPLDTHLHDPTIVDTCKNIITSDYGTDDDLRLEDDCIQIDNEEEDNDSDNASVDIKPEIDELFMACNRLQPNQDKSKVPTIYIDDDDDLMVCWEEEVKTSDKSSEREKEEKERQLVLKEKQNEAFTNHRPMILNVSSDTTTGIKEEVIDEDEMFTPKSTSCSDNLTVNTSNTRRKRSFLNDILVTDDNCNAIPKPVLTVDDKLAQDVVGLKPKLLTNSEQIVSDSSCLPQVLVEGDSELTTVKETLCFRSEAEDDSTNGKHVNAKENRDGNYNEATGELNISSEIKVISDDYNEISTPVLPHDNTLTKDIVCSKSQSIDNSKQLVSNTLSCLPQMVGLEEGDSKLSTVEETYFLSEAEDDSTTGKDVDAKENYEMNDELKISSDITSSVLKTNLVDSFPRNWLSEEAKLDNFESYYVIEARESKISEPCELQNQTVQIQNKIEPTLQVSNNDQLAKHQDVNDEHTLQKDSTDKSHIEIDRVKEPLNISKNDVEECNKNNEFAIAEIESNRGNEEKLVQKRSGFEEQTCDNALHFDSGQGKYSEVESDTRLDKTSDKVILEIAQNVAVDEIENIDENSEIGQNVAVGEIKNIEENSKTAQNVAVDEIENIDENSEIEQNVAVHEIKNIEENSKIAQNVAVDEIENIEENSEIEQNVAVDEIKSIEKNSKIDQNVAVDEIQDIEENAEDIESSKSEELGEKSTTHLDSTPKVVTNDDNPIHQVMNLNSNQETVDANIMTVSKPTREITQDIEPLVNEELIDNMEKPLEVNEASKEIPTMEELAEKPVTIAKFIKVVLKQHSSGSRSEGIMSNFQKSNDDINIKTPETPTTDVVEAKFIEVGHKEHDSDSRSEEIMSNFQKPVDDINIETPETPITDVIEEETFVHLETLHEETTDHEVEVDADKEIIDSSNVKEIKCTILESTESTERYNSKETFTSLEELPENKQLKSIATNSEESGKNINILEKPVDEIETVEISTNKTAEDSVESSICIKKYEQLCNISKPHEEIEFIAEKAIDSPDSKIKEGEEKCIEENIEEVNDKATETEKYQDAKNVDLYDKSNVEDTRVFTDVCENINDQVKLANKPTVEDIEKPTEQNSTVSPVSKSQFHGVTDNIQLEENHELARKRSVADSVNYEEYIQEMEINHNLPDGHPKLIEKPTVQNTASDIETSIVVERVIESDNDENGKNIIENSDSSIENTDSIQEQETQNNGEERLAKSINDIEVSIDKQMEDLTKPTNKTLEISDKVIFCEEKSLEQNIAHVTEEDAADKLVDIAHEEKGDKITEKLKQDDCSEIPTVDEPFQGVTLSKETEEIDKNIVRVDISQDTDKEELEKKLADLSETSVNKDKLLAFISTDVTEKSIQQKIAFDTENAIVHERDTETIIEDKEENIAEKSVQDSIKCVTADQSLDCVILNENIHISGKNIEIIDSQQNSEILENEEEICKTSNKDLEASVMIEKEEIKEKSFDTFEKSVGNSNREESDESPKSDEEKIASEFLSKDMTDKSVEESIIEENVIKITEKTVQAHNTESITTDDQYPEEIALDEEVEITIEKNMEDVDDLNESDASNNREIYKESHENKTNFIEKETKELEASVMTEKEEIKEKSFNTFEKSVGDSNQEESDETPKLDEEKTVSEFLSKDMTDKSVEENIPSITVKAIVEESIIEENVIEITEKTVVTTDYQCPEEEALNEEVEITTEKSMKDVDDLYKSDASNNREIYKESHENKTNFIEKETKEIEASIMTEKEETKEESFDTFEKSVGNSNEEESNETPKSDEEKIVSELLSKDVTDISVEENIPSITVKATVEESIIEENVIEITEKTVVTTDDQCPEEIALHEEVEITTEKNMEDVDDLYESDASNNREIYKESHENKANFIEKETKELDVSVMTEKEEIKEKSVGNSNQEESDETPKSDEEKIVSELLSKDMTDKSVEENIPSITVKATVEESLIEENVIEITEKTVQANSTGSVTTDDQCPEEIALNEEVVITTGKNMEGVHEVHESDASNNREIYKESHENKANFFEKEMKDTEKKSSDTLEEVGKLNLNQEKSVEVAEMESISSERDICKDPENILENENISKNISELNVVINNNQEIICDNKDPDICVVTCKSSSNYKAIHDERLNGNKPKTADFTSHEEFHDGLTEVEFINELNIQKQEIVTDTNILKSSVSEDTISDDTPKFNDYRKINVNYISKSGESDSNQITSQNSPTQVSMEASADSILEKMKDALKKIGTEIIAADSDTKVEPEKIVQDLEICAIPNENTSLDILATVASKVPRQNLLAPKRKRKGAKKGKKKQNVFKHKCTVVNIKQPVKIVPEYEQKCKPHDFVIVSNTEISPPANNIYTQKLPDISVTSEDSNDSEGNLLIDEDADIKNNKPPKAILAENRITEDDVIQTEKLSPYDEDTFEEEIIFACESKVKGTVQISIPDNYQANFDILKQIEEVELCSSNNLTNVNHHEENNKNEHKHENIDYNTIPCIKDNLSAAHKTPNQTEKLEMNHSSNEVATKVDIHQEIEKPTLEQLPSKNSDLKVNSYKPFRAVEEIKKYDKFKLNPYVSIERLNICCKVKEEEKCIRTRSKSFDIGIIRNSKRTYPDVRDQQEIYVNQTNAASTPNTEPEPKICVEENVDDDPDKSKNSVELKSQDMMKSSTDHVDNLPLTKLKPNLETECPNEEQIHESALDDVPLLLRKPTKIKRRRKKIYSSKTVKQKKGKVVRQKVEKRQTENNSDKSVKHKKSKDDVMEANDSSNIMTRLRRKSSLDNPEDVVYSHVTSDDKVSEIDCKPKTKIGSKNFTLPVTNDVTLNSEKKDSLVLKLKIEHEQTHLNTHEDELTLFNKTPKKPDKNITNEDDTVGNANRKYYTTPKLRRKSISKDNLNRIERNSVDVVSEDSLNSSAPSDEKKLPFSSDKKYYTAPKLRRKTAVKNDNILTKDTPKKITLKQFKPSTYKVDILSKSKNPVSPTIEKLKKKLEIDFKLSCDEIIFDKPNFERLSVESTENNVIPVQRTAEECDDQLKEDEDIISKSRAKQDKRNRSKSLPKIEDEITTTVTNHKNNTSNDEKVSEGNVQYNLIHFDKDYINDQNVINEEVVEHLEMLDEQPFKILINTDSVHITNPKEKEMESSDIKVTEKILDVIELENILSGDAQEIYKEMDKSKETVVNSETSAIKCEITPSHLLGHSPRNKKSEDSENISSEINIKSKSPEKVNSLILDTSVIGKEIKAKKSTKHIENNNLISPKVENENLSHKSPNLEVEPLKCGQTCQIISDADLPCGREVKELVDQHEDSNDLDNVPLLERALKFVDLQDSVNKPEKRVKAGSNKKNRKRSVTVDTETKVQKEKEKYEADTNMENKIQKEDTSSKKLLSENVQNKDKFDKTVSNIEETQHFKNKKSSGKQNSPISSPITPNKQKVADINNFDKKIQKSDAKLSEGIQETVTGGVNSNKNKNTFVEEYKKDEKIKTDNGRKQKKHIDTNKKSIKDTKEEEKSSNTCKKIKETRKSNMGKPQTPSTETKSTSVSSTLEHECQNINTSESHPITLTISLVKKDSLISTIKTSTSSNSKTVNDSRRKEHYTKSSEKSNSDKNKIYDKSKSSSKDIRHEHKKEKDRSKNHKSKSRSGSVSSRSSSKPATPDSELSDKYEENKHDKSKYRSSSVSSSSSSTKRATPDISEKERREHRSRERSKSKHGKSATKDSELSDKYEKNKHDDKSKYRSSSVSSSSSSTKRATPDKLEKERREHHNRGRSKSKHGKPDSELSDKYEKNKHDDKSKNRSSSVSSSSSSTKRATPDKSEKERREHRNRGRSKSKHGKPDSELSNKYEKTKHDKSTYRSSSVSSSSSSTKRATPDISEKERREHRNHERSKSKHGKRDSELSDKYKNNKHDESKYRSSSVSSSSSSTKRASPDISDKERREHRNREKSKSKHGHSKSSNSSSRSSEVNTTSSGRSTKKNSDDTKLIDLRSSNTTEKLDNSSKQTEIKLILKVGNIENFKARNKTSKEDEKRKNTKERKRRKSKTYSKQNDISPAKRRKTVDSDINTTENATGDSKISSDRTDPKIKQPEPSTTEENLKSLTSDKLNGSKQIKDSLAEIKDCNILIENEHNLTTHREPLKKVVIKLKPDLEKVKDSQDIAIVVEPLSNSKVQQDSELLNVGNANDANVQKSPELEKKSKVIEEEEITKNKTDSVLVKDIGMNNESVSKLSQNLEADKKFEISQENLLSQPDILNKISDAKLSEKIECGNTSSKLLIVEDINNTNAPKSPKFNENLEALKTNDSLEMSDDNLQKVMEPTRLKEIVKEFIKSESLNVDVHKKNVTLLEQNSKELINTQVTQIDDIQLNNELSKAEHPKDTSKDSIRMELLNTDELNDKNAEKASELKQTSEEIEKKKITTVSLIIEESEASEEKCLAESLNVDVNEEAPKLKQNLEETKNSEIVEVKDLHDRCDNLPKVLEVTNSEVAKADKNSASLNFEEVNSKIDEKSSVVDENSETIEEHKIVQENAICLDDGLNKMAELKSVEDVADVLTSSESLNVEVNENSAGQASQLKQNSEEIEKYKDVQTNASHLDNDNLSKVSEVKCLEDTANDFSDSKLLSVAEVNEKNVEQISKLKQSSEDVQNCQLLKANDDASQDLEANNSIEIIKDHAKLESLNVVDDNKPSEQTNSISNQNSEPETIENGKIALRIVDDNLSEVSQAKSSEKISKDLTKIELLHTEELNETNGEKHLDLQEKNTDIEANNAILQVNKINVCEDISGKKIETEHKVSTDCATKLEKNNSNLEYVFANNNKANKTAKLENEGIVKQKDESQEIKQIPDNDMKLNKDDECIVVQSSIPKYENKAKDIPEKIVPQLQEHKESTGLAKDEISDLENDKVTPEKHVEEKREMSSFKVAEAANLEINHNKLDYDVFKNSSTAVETAKLKNEKVVKQNVPQDIIRIPTYDTQQNQKRSCVVVKSSKPKCENKKQKNMPAETITQLREVTEPVGGKIADPGYDKVKAQAKQLQEGREGLTPNVAENKQNKDVITVPLLNHAETPTSKYIPDVKRKKVYGREVKLKNIEDAFEQYLPTKPKENEETEEATNKVNTLAKVQNKPNNNQLSSKKRKSNVLNSKPVSVTKEDISVSVMTNKKARLEEVNNDASCETQLNSKKSPTQISPLSISLKRKDRKSIEVIISHLKEEKSGNSIPNVDDMKNEVKSSSVDGISVDKLRSKLLQKIKCPDERPTPPIKDLVQSRRNSGEECFKHVPENVEITKVGSAFSISQGESDKIHLDVQDSPKSILDFPRESEPIVEVGGDSIQYLSKKINTVTGTTRVEYNIEIDKKLKDSISGNDSEMLVSPAENNLKPTTPKQINRNENSFLTPQSNVFINDSSPRKHDMRGFEKEEIIESSLVDDVIESSFIDNSLHIPPIENNVIGSLDPSTSRESPNLLNLSDLIMHVDSTSTNVSNMEEITVSPEAVCMYPGIMSTPINSTENKLPCSNSPGTLKLFTFPVTSEADIKEEFIPLNDVSKNSNFLDTDTTSGKVGSLHESCVYSFSEQIDNSNARTLSSPGLALNLQDVPFSDIPIGSTQSFDLISPKSLSMVQTSRNNNFTNDVPVGNEISDIMTEIICSNEPDDHNYTLGPVGGPLVSGRLEQENKNISPTTFNKPLDDSPNEFSLNDAQLQEFEFSDDTYKLNLDNEYAVKNLVILGSQTTTDTNAFPLTNYNVADIKRMNLIDCSISNSEENTNSKEYLDSIKQETQSMPNDANPWAEFIANENPNQKVVVLSNERVTITENEFIESIRNNIVENGDETVKADKTVETAIPISSSVAETCLTQETLKAELPKVIVNTRTNKEYPTRNRKNVSDEPAQKDNSLSDFISKRRYSRTLLRPKKKNSAAPSVKEPKKEVTVKTASISEAGTSNVVLNEINPQAKSLMETNITATSTKKSTLEDNACLLELNKFIQTTPAKILKESNDTAFKMRPTIDLIVPQFENKRKSPSQSHLSPARDIIDKQIVKTKQNQTISSLSKDPSEKGNLQQKSYERRKSPRGFHEDLLQPTFTDIAKVTDIPKASENLQKNPPVPSIAELVKSRKRTATNKYPNNYSLPTASATKETSIKTDTIKPTKSTSLDKPRLEEGVFNNTVNETRSKIDLFQPVQEYKKVSSQSHLQNQKSPVRGTLANLTKPLPELEGKGQSSYQTRSNIQKNIQDSADNLTKSIDHLMKYDLLPKKPIIPPTTPAEPPKTTPSKYNYSIDSILSKDTKSFANNYNSENPVKDYRQPKNRGAKRSSSLAEDEKETGKVDSKAKQRKIDSNGAHQSSNSRDATFDELLQQGNVNRLISLRVTEDNKLKPERRSSPLLAERRSSPLSTERRNSPLSTERKNSPLSAERKNSPLSTERKNSPLSIERKNSPLATERKNSPLLKSHNKAQNEREDSKLTPVTRSSPLVSKSYNNNDKELNEREGINLRLESSPIISRSYDKNKEQNQRDPSNLRSSIHPVYDRLGGTSTRRDKNEMHGKRTTSRRSHHHPYQPPYLLSRSNARETLTETQRVQDVYNSDHIVNKETTRHPGYYRGREDHQFDHGRGRQGLRSEHTRGREGFPTDFNRVREGLIAEHSRGRGEQTDRSRRTEPHQHIRRIPEGQRFEYMSTSAHSALMSQPSTSRSTNMSGLYYNNPIGGNQNVDPADKAAYEASGSYPRRTTKMTPEEKEALLQSCQVKILDSLRPAEDDKDEGEYSWIDKFTERLPSDSYLLGSSASTPQFFPKPSP